MNDIKSVDFKVKTRNNTKIQGIVRKVKRINRRINSNQLKVKQKRDIR